MIDNELSVQLQGRCIRNSQIQAPRSQSQHAEIFRQPHGKSVHTLFLGLFYAASEATITLTASARFRTRIKRADPQRTRLGNSEEICHIFARSWR
jgi:hypothetical protein